MRSSTRAIVPSSFITSQITPAGLRPASRARSTAASVWPARSSTPPRRARSGKTWPGWTSASGPFEGSIATWIVRERSCAEIPVVIPSRASIETVNAVPYGVSFRSAIGRSSSSSQRVSVRQRQTRPRPCVAMKLTASGVANWAAIVRSPSFSRSAASTTTTNLPCRTSSIASSIVANALRCCVFIARIVTGSIAPGLRDEALDVLREQVDLQVDGVAAAERAERRLGERVRDDRDGESGVVELYDRQRDAFDGHGALLDEVAAQR